MKKIFQMMVLALAGLAAGCSKEVQVNLDVPGAADYAQLYMPQANQYPIEKSLSISDSVYSFMYNAYLGGSQDNNQRITVKFAVDPSKVAEYNLKNGTSYQLMPEGSYEIQAEEGIIPSGSRSTGALSLKIKTKGFMLPFQTYLLPVGIREANAKINTDLMTSYYLITGAYAPGEVPREKAIGFGTAGVGNILFDFDGKLIRKTNEGNLLLYPSNADGTFGAPGQIGQGWNIFNLIFYFGGDRLIGRWASGGGDITQYAISPAGGFGASKNVGLGWGIFTKIIPYKGLLLGVEASGNMNMYPLDAAGNFDYGKIKSIGQGWNASRQLFAYKNSLISVENNGDMYQYPLSETGEFGARKKVGSGWDMYTLVFAAGDDLLGLDSNGDLWRYKFNPIGFWPLKK